MKKSLIAIAGVTVLSCASAAYSASGPYLSVNAGLGMLDDLEMILASVGSDEVGIALESDSGVAGSVSFGVRFNDFFRLEAELASQGNDVDALTAFQTIGGVTETVTVPFENEDISSVSLTGFANGYFDFPTQSMVTPFVSIGIGYSSVELDLAGETFDDTALSYQIGGGINFAFNSVVSLDVKYRYFSTPGVELGEQEMDYESHNVYGGFRFSF